MSQKQRADKKSKWLRLAVGAALLTGVSGAMVPSTVGAAEATVTDDGTYYSGLWKKDNPGVEDKDWKFAGDNSGNTVTFDGFEAGYDHNCAAGSNMADGEGTPGDADVTGNTITIKNSKMWGKVAGGYSTGDQEVSGNVVTIGEGTTVADGGSLQIFGGISKADSQNIKNNTVNILTSITLDALKGAENSTYSAGNNGNTLNIAAKNVTTQWFGGFENINFFLPSDIAAGDTMLKVTNEYGTDLNGVNVGVAAQSGVKLVKGDTVNLLESTKLSNAPTGDRKIDSNIKNNIKMVAAGDVLSDTEYTFELGSTDTTLTATVKDIQPYTGDSDGGESSNVLGSDEEKASAIKTSQRVKSLVETPEAAAMMINRGSDMLTGAGFTQAKVAADASEGGEFAPFAAVGGSNLRANSGSHVDTKGYNLNVGFAREVKKGNKTYLLAPVVEYGRGSYDSYQNNGIKADGKSRLWGVGVMGRQTNSRGLYYEGSLRAGRVKSDYSSQLSVATHASYDSSSSYWAGHLGVGTVSKLKGNNTLDTYAKYFYSHMDGDEVDVKINGAAGADQITFDSVESERLRLGARFTHHVNDNNSVYVGAAYQYEIKGDARATYHGCETASPSVKGSSGMMELGWQIKPGKSPVSVDLGVTGWAGKQRGVVGNLGFKYNF